MLIRNSEKTSSGGTLEIREPELDDDGVVIDLGTLKVIPTYTCGHCSDVIRMRPERTRDRVRCKSCMRLICEKKQICRVDCTPLYAMSLDHFEDAGKFGRLVPAIMAGCETEDEARERGLIT